MRRLDDGVKAFQRQEKGQGVAPLVFWGEGGVLLPVVPPAQVDARTSPSAVDSNSTDDAIEWEREVERQLKEAGKLLRQQNLHLVTAVAVGSHALLRPEDICPPNFHANDNQDDAPASQHAATTALLRPDGFAGAFQCQEEGNTDSALPGLSGRSFYAPPFDTNGSQDDAPASQHAATALVRPDAFAGAFQCQEEVNADSAPPGSSRRTFYPLLFHTNERKDDAPASQPTATALLRPDAFTRAFQYQEEGHADSAPPGASRRTFYPLLFHTNGRQNGTLASQYTTATALLGPDAFAGAFQS
ncbi:unnamed protein product [Ectocarpus sp. 13 AM-2016]